MTDDRVVTILGDLASYVDEINECLATDITKLRSISEFDELKREIKTLKASIVKSSTQLKHLKDDEDTIRCIKWIKEYI